MSETLPDQDHDNVPDEAPPIPGSPDTGPDEVPEAPDDPTDRPVGDGPVNSA